MGWKWVRGALWERGNGSVLSTEDPAGRQIPLLRLKSTRPRPCREPSALVICRGTGNACPLSPAPFSQHQSLPFSTLSSKILLPSLAPKPGVPGKGVLVSLDLSVPPREGTGTFTGRGRVTHGFVAFPHQSLRGAAAYVAAFKGPGRRRQAPARPAQNRPNLGKQVGAGRGQGAASHAPGRGKREERDPEPRGTQPWLCRHGGEGMEAGDPKGLCSRAAASGEGTGFPGSAAAGAALRSAWEGGRGELGTFLVGRSPAMASGAFTQSQGDPSGRPCCCSALTPV